MLAVSDCKIIALSWNEPLLTHPRLDTRIAGTIENYYRTFEQLLDCQVDSLVVPCTQRGIVLSNQLGSRHRVLAEPYLDGYEAFDKLNLRRQQYDIAHLLIPCYSVRDPLLPLPALVKPRMGHSSQNQVVLKKRADGIHLHEGYFAEPLLSSERDEYSLTIVASSAGRKWSCIRRIEQQDGHTVVASRDVPSAPRAFAQEIAERANLDVIYNMQFAWLGDSGVIFDLNPRFGNAELFRTCFGFNFISAWLSQSSIALSDATTLTEVAANAAITAKICQLVDKPKGLYQNTQ
ncbi:MAG: hypothetical protein N838_15915 [Thiohalocapsa sp. PB-PSB1]|jgi:hypothetical protein|nr:MAG: hypothetical protein N838_15915 [Thiohalocapsa sp. PB-PSB1]HCS91909.1 hypothetical protein [Chromatiaceae bacterium]